MTVRELINKLEMLGCEMQNTQIGFSEESQWLPILHAIARRKEEQKRQSPDDEVIELTGELYPPYDYVVGRVLF